MGGRLSGDDGQIAVRFNCRPPSGVHLFLPCRLALETSMHFHSGPGSRMKKRARDSAIVLWYCAVYSSR